MDYGNIVYDQPKNDTFSEKLESVQYKGTLLIAGIIHSTSRENLYETGFGNNKVRKIA